MIHVLLTLLKIIGIIILVLLVLVIAIVLTVLLIPVRYSICADVNEDTKVSLRISWLLGLIKVRADYSDNALNYNARLAFYPIADSSHPEKKKKKTRKKKAGKKSADTFNTSDEAAHENEELKPDITDKESLQQTENPSVSKADLEAGNVLDLQETPKQTDYDKDKAGKKIKRKKKYAFPDINGIIAGIAGKAGKILEMVNDNENKEFVIFILENLKKIISHIRPGKHDIYLYFGADDPSVTGQAYGAYCVINSILGLNFIFEPEFNKKILKLRAVISGRIRVLNLLTAGVKVYFNKTFRKLIGGSV